jgi:hypothetical protein
MEVASKVPVEELFKEENVKDPVVRDLLEWHISGGYGRDGIPAPAISYDVEHDALEPLPGFEQRAERWRKLGDMANDRYHLRELPSEGTFRDYLSGPSAFFNFETGRLEHQSDLNRAA